MARVAEVLPRVRRYPRGVFLDRVWRHRPDEHVTILGRTGSGKTQLAQDLLARTATPEYPAVVLVMKHRDETVDKWMKTVVSKRVTFWSRPVTKWQPKQPIVYAVWPRHAFKTTIDNPHHYDVFEHAIMDNYRQGNRIVFCDEVSGLQRLGLTDELETVWERGRGMDCSLWSASQRPTHISSHAYNQASHIFLGKITDRRAKERFGEISGVDEKLVRHTVGTLRRWEWLYIRQEDQVMCIVEAD